jgi:methionine-gamma-lyase
MSTTFVVDDADAQFSANALSDDAPFLYTRWANPTVRQLETKLADLEGGEAAVAFGSGMAATTALLLHVLKAGDHLIVSDVTYAGVAELVRDTLPRFGIEVEPVDLTDLEALGQALRAETRLVYAETPSNPILKLTDLEAVSRLAHEAGARLVVDSTFATPVATRPLERGADFVVHSLTKYIGGHGDAVVGAVVGGAEAMGALTQDTAIHAGGVLSPFNAWLIMRGMATACAARRTAAGMCRDDGVVSVVSSVFLGVFVFPNLLASSRSSFSVTASSMILPRSPSGTDERMRACSRCSLSRSTALAVNWTL